MPTLSNIMFKTLVAAAFFALVMGASPRLEFEVPAPVRSLCRTHDGRTFLSFVQNNGSQGPALVEFFPSDGTTKAFPSEQWNDAHNDPAHYFIGVTAQRIGPDGLLYVLDSGVANPDEVLDNGPPAKIIQIDVDSGEVKSIWNLGSVTKPNSFLGDFRFNDKVAYITDTMAPAIIVLDLESGQARRVLEDAHSTKAHFPMSCEGRIMRKADNTPVLVNVIYLEVCPMGKYVYFQSGSGGLHRIETQYLVGKGTDSDGALEDRVEPFALTVSSGGTAIDADGNLYSSDTDFQRIIKISPDGQMTEMAQDPRLLHANLWLDSSERLFITASQLNRAPMMNAGKDLFQKPFQVFTLDIGAGPSPIDHN